MKTLLIPVFRTTMLFLLTSCTLFPAGESEQPLNLEGSRAYYGNTEILAGISFPPFANGKQIDFTLEKLDTLAIDRIRIAIDWRNREPEQGRFYWDPMDKRMEAARKAGISVFLTVHSLAPDWARLPDGEDGACLMNEDALESFVEAVLTRYGNIEKIQFGNEWESGAQDGTAYLDRASLEKFVVYSNILYDTVQRVSPETEVVLGGLTRTWPLNEAFLAQGHYPDFSRLDLARGVSESDLRARLDRSRANYDESGIKGNVAYVLAHARYDILDIHLYDDPENWADYLGVLPRDKPILVSEFGGPNSEFENTDPDYQAERMDDYIDAIERLPVREAYYFKLVDSEASYHQDSGLYFANGKPKPARNAFAERLTPGE